MRRANREIKDPLELEEILRTCDSCRIAIHAGTFPYIIALNYGYEYENGALTLYFHSANQGRKLDLLREDPHVGFQMDCDHVFRHLDRGMQCTELADAFSSDTCNTLHVAYFTLRQKRFTTRRAVFPHATWLVQSADH